MLEINGNTYKLCLIDTNVLSNLLKSPKDWIEYLHRAFNIEKTVICYSIFSLSELWYKPDLFQKYLDVFSEFPSAVLDGHESIFVKETDNYQIKKVINPVALTPFAIHEPSMSPRERLAYVLEKSPFIGRTEYWKNSQNKVLESIVGLKENYPPENKKYTKQEIEFFCFVTGTTQVGLRNKGFADGIMGQKMAIELDRFPSIKTTSYVVFYKFYPDNRNPEPSDIFDIFISSLLPYVDFFVTERNLKHIINQIQKKHDFLLNVECFTMKQIREKTYTNH